MTRSSNVVFKKLNSSVRGRFTVYEVSNGQAQAQHDLP